MSSDAIFLNHDEILEGKFTTLERITYLNSLKKEILRKIRKIDAGEIAEMVDDDE